MDWRDSVLLATRYPVDWRDSVLSGLRYPVDWRGSVLLAPQVPYGLVEPGNLGTERHGRTCPSRNILCVHNILWRLSTGGLVHAKREKRGLVFVLVLIVFSFYQNQMECLEYDTYNISSILYTFLKKLVRSTRYTIAYIY